MNFFALFTNFSFDPEPTNHLDLEAVLWLESYLQSYRHTLIVVSHDRSFLNEVCTDTIEFAKRKLTYYKGDYDTYVKTSDEMVKNSMRVYQAYQDKRAHMMEFINKFRASAARAKLVQSRVKMVEKMDLEAPVPVSVEAMWRFSIPNPAVRTLMLFVHHKQPSIVFIIFLWTHTPSWTYFIVDIGTHNFGPAAIGKANHIH